MPIVLEREVGRERVGPVLELLADREFVLASLPYVVGRAGDEVTLMFSRLLFRFRDRYRLSIEGGSAQGFVTHVFEGQRSTMRFEYRGVDGRIVVDAEYRGPRGWVVSKHLPEIASALLEDAVKASEKMAAAPGVAGDFSRLLASLSWTSRLLMKSILLKNELTMIPKGGLMSYIEGLIAEKILEKYPVVYVSGTSDNASFRLLFVNGSLRGVYVVVSGKEYVGNERTLNEVEGITRVKVYASLSKPEEVLKP